MRSRLGALLALSIVVFLVATVSYSREANQDQVRFQQGISEGEYLSDISGLDPGLAARYSSTAVDTYCIVWYNFEPNTWQGWTRFDDTEQRGIFFHADDFAGLGGGYSPLEGTKSIWCGVRPDTLDPYLCGWQSAPGYGNDWHQILVSDAHSGATRVSYSARFDTEPGYDFVYVEYQDNREWKNLATYDGFVEVDAEHAIALPRLQTKVRFRFVSDSEWSDQDGLHDTDGAAIIDDITIFDSEGPISHEGFEYWAVGATSYGFSRWDTEVPEPFGMYSGLMSNLYTDVDPCNYNFGTQIVFFIGSSNPSPAYPGLFTTPLCLTYGDSPEDWLCQDERVISPIIDLTMYSASCDVNQDADIPTEKLPELGGAILRFALFEDGPFSNLVFPEWEIRSIDENGCPGQWVGRNFIVYYRQIGYSQAAHQIGDLIESDRIQIALICRDMCSVWYDSYGDCQNHTLAPWFDNVRLYRYSLRGPHWSYRDLDLFQDNFPEDEFDLESYVRADAANDLNPSDNPAIRPGDSIVVDCVSTRAGGLRIGGPISGEEVYLNARITDIGISGKPALFGPQLVGTYGTYVSDDGEWTVIQCPTALMGGAYPVEDKYMVDLNDELFTRGYMIEYYFEAYDLDNDRSTLPEHADEGQYFEFTCLPTGNGDILFVDDFSGRGTFEGTVENYWNATFDIFGGGPGPDRYDVNSPSSMVGNGLASRAKLNQIIYNDIDHYGYSIIIWDSGNLWSGTITDGSTLSDKVDDCSLLINWLDQSDNIVGLLVCGDDVAYDLNRLPSPQAANLMNDWCGVNYIETSYFDLTGGRLAGGIVNPLITCEGIFDPSWELHIFGGCPVINQFDVLEPVANGVPSLKYPDFEGDPYYAGIQSMKTNSMGYDVRTMWLGFSWMNIRDSEVTGDIPIRVWLYTYIYWWFIDAMSSPPTGDEVPGVYSLSQNFPNPFNPTTTIRFDIKKKGHVRLRIYNVAGQLVKTMVDEVMDAGSYAKEWKGKNNLGAEVASGVYFYRLEAGEYENVKKMVLLR